MSAIYGIEKFYALKENYHAIESDVTENADVCIIGSRLLVQS